MKGDHKVVDEAYRIDTHTILLKDRHGTVGTDPCLSVYLDAVKQFETVGSLFYR